MKRAVIFLMLLGVTVPFVLLTDVYPFFRFGMFAEPVRRAVQAERFVVRYLDASGRPHAVAPAEVGLGELVYLLRNYHYRGETGRLLERLHGLHARRAEAAEWQLLRITTPAHVYRPDTTTVDRWKPEK
ncbi:MAG: hypothetical protein ICV83_22845 [Cytophagales bacterium]|nr:hypothetical protein [Cytophagales bacterium]